MYTWAAWLVAGTVIIGAFWLHLRGDDKVEAKLLTCQVNAVAYEDSQKTNLGAITKLTLANSAWSDYAGDYEQRNTILQANLEKQRTSSEVRRIKDQAEFKRIIANEQKSKELANQRITDTLADWVCSLPAYSCTD